jgi:hypothetical protein
VLGGSPAQPIRAWHRQTIGLARMFKSADGNGKE